MNKAKIKDQLKKETLTTKQITVVKETKIPLLHLAAVEFHENNMGEVYWIDSKNTCKMNYFTALGYQPNQKRKINVARAFNKHQHNTLIKKVQSKNPDLLVIPNIEYNYLEKPGKIYKNTLNQLKGLDCAIITSTFRENEYYIELIADNILKNQEKTENHIKQSENQEKLSKWSERDKVKIERGVKIGKNQ